MPTLQENPTPVQQQSAIEMELTRLENVQRDLAHLIVELENRMSIAMKEPTPLDVDKQTMPPPTSRLANAIRCRSEEAENMMYSMMQILRRLEL